MGYVVFSDGDVFLIEGLRYAGLVLFEEGLYLFSSLMELSFRPLVILWWWRIYPSSRRW